MFNSRTPFRRRSGHLPLVVVMLLLFNCFLCSAMESSQTANSLENATSAQIIEVPPPSPTKRDVQVQDSSGSASAKAYDPPPEFYRGPGSLPNQSGSTTYNNFADTTSSGFVSKTVPYPSPTSPYNRNKYETDPSEQLANSFNNWQQQQRRGQFRPTSSYNLQDRISVGHHGSASGTATDAHNPVAPPHHYQPYDSRLGYGTVHPVDYVVPGSGNVHFPHHSEPSHYGSSYYPPPGGSSAEGIPFDVYGGGSKGIAGGHYAGAGGEYSFTYPDHQDPAAHKMHGGGGGGGDHAQKALLAKSFLIPLASAAVLGIAAALVSNPLLLQLGTVSGGGAIAPAIIGKRRRRKRRDLQKYTTEPTARENQLQMEGLQLAYRAHLHH